MGRTPDEASAAAGWRDSDGASGAGGFVPAVETSHLARAGDRFGGPFDSHPVAARGDIDAQPLFEREQIRVIFAEQAGEELRLVERNLYPAAFAGLGGYGLAAHAIP
mgnify:CR=1 FL=1